MQLQLISNPNTDFSDIANLYTACFGTEQGVQLTNNEQIINYFRNSINAGGVCQLLTENGKTIAALLAVPPATDELMPHQIQHLISQKSIYIAELMVDKAYRGQGIGEKLLSKTLEKFKGFDVLIRVWKENTAALKLYQKLGFTQVATIRQTKTKTDGKTFFEMEKVYLHKKT